MQVVNPDSLSAAQLRLTPQHWSGPPGEQCYVDKVLLTQNDEMEEIYKVRQAVHLDSNWLDERICWLQKLVVSICAGWKELGVARSEVATLVLGCLHIDPAHTE